MVIPDIQHDTYPGIIRGIQDTGGRPGIDVILSNTDNSVRRQTACLERFLEGGTDGIILIPAVYEGTDLRPLMRILERRVPLVLCNREVPGIQAPVVKSDNFLGGKLAVRHLVSTGRRRIAYVSPPIYQTSAERYQGYLAALAENGLEQDPSLVSFACAPGEPENALRAVTRLLQRRADGVFCFNDAAACVVYDAAARLGRKVGRELAVVGYDNTPPLRELPPQADDGGLPDIRGRAAGGGAHLRHDGGGRIRPAAVGGGRALPDRPGEYARVKRKTEGVCGV